MKNGILILWATVAIWMMGAGYYFDSESLAPPPRNAGDALLTDGDENYWGTVVGGEDACYWQRNGTILTPVTDNDTAWASTVVAETELNIGTLLDQGVAKWFDGSGNYTELKYNSSGLNFQYSWPIVPPAALPAYLCLGTATGGIYQWEWTPGNVIYSDELAQDAIGAEVTDSTTIEIDYVDATPDLHAHAITQMSITSDASGLKLSGDATSPGNNYHYGTNGSGTKGWILDLWQRVGTVLSPVTAGDDLQVDDATIDDDLTVTDFVTADRAHVGGTSDPGVNNLLVDGNVTITDPPRARAYLNGDQLNLTDATWTKVALNGESYDSGSHFDSATNYRFTPTIDGYYMISAQVEFENAIVDKRYDIALYFNGAAVVWSVDTPSLAGYITVTTSDIMYFDTNDYIELWVRSNAGVNTVDMNGTAGDTFLACHKIS